MSRPGFPYKVYLLNYLRDPDARAGYLDACREESEDGVVVKLAERDCRQAALGHKWLVADGATPECWQVSGQHSTDYSVMCELCGIASCHYHWEGINTMCGGFEI